MNEKLGHKIVLFITRADLATVSAICIFFQSTFIFWTGNQGNQAGGTVVPVNTDWEQCQTQVPNVPMTNVILNVLMT